MTPQIDLVVVAKAVVKLQDLRHTADYDTDARFSRGQTEDAIRTASDAFDAWEACPAHSRSGAVAGERTHEAPPMTGTASLADSRPSLPRGGAGTVAPRISYEEYYPYGATAWWAQQGRHRVDVQ